MFRLKTLNRQIKSLDERCELVMGNGYQYFLFDDVEQNVYEMESVYVPRLNDLPLIQWIEMAYDFIENVKEEKGL
jgi:hypothetical protein